jgi:regulator of cell morphogenesis and NO signaling
LNVIINNETLVADLVLQDHRAAGVFGKHNINYCCAGKTSLEAACSLNNLDVEMVKKDLEHALRIIQIPASTDFNSWSIDFLVDYIINIHHAYLVVNMPDITGTIERFVRGHQSKYPNLDQLLQSFHQLNYELFPHLEQEETVIFPYIKQVAHAYESQEPYAALLVRTLRKPIETMIQHEQEHITAWLDEFRQLTNNYTPPPGACVTHKVAFSKLKELDADLVQHIYLENEVLFPKAIQIEKQLKADYK